MLPLRDDNPTRTFPAVTIALIAINVILFIYQASLPAGLRDELVMTRGLVPGAVTALPRLGPGAIGTVALSFLTSMFLHGSLLHLGGNMLYLWIFGNNIEDRMGHVRFPIFYLLCGLAAGLTQVAMLPGSPVPMVGASGAIAGVLGAYIILFPNARILTVVPIFIFLHFVKLRAFVVLGIWFLFQILYSMMSDPAQGGVAWFAHIGGFLAGMALLFLFLPRRRRRPPTDDAEVWI